MADYVGDEKTILELIKKHEQERQEAVKEGIIQAANIGATVISTGAPKDLGALQESVKVQAGPVISIDAPHAVAVELGTRPFYPPWAPLFAWVQRHISTGEDARAITQAIRNKIAQFGIKPTWFVKGKLPILKEILRNVIEPKLVK